MSEIQEMSVAEAHKVLKGFVVEHEAAHAEVDEDDMADALEDAIAQGRVPPAVSEALDVLMEAGELGQPEEGLEGTEDEDPAAIQSAIAGMNKTIREIEKLEADMEREVRVRDELEKVQDAAPPATTNGDSPTPPAIRDASSLMERLDHAAKRAERLGHMAERMTGVVGGTASFRGDGPAYMNVAVKAVREETRIYETALKLAQVLVSQGGYSVSQLRDKSWVGKDEDPPA